MKKLLLVLFLVSVSISVFALEFSGALHFDTYSRQPTVGVSFHATGELFPHVNLITDLDYLRGNNYEAKILAQGKYNWFVGAGGFALTINGNSHILIVPGISGYLGMDFSSFNMGFFGTLSLAPADLYKAYGFSAGVDVNFLARNHLVNLNTSVRQSVSKPGYDTSFLFKVDMFDKGHPFAINVGSSIDSLLGAEEGFNFDLTLLGGASIPTKNYGTYFVTAALTPFSFGKAITVPFEIAVGVEFSL